MVQEVPLLFPKTAPAAGYEQRIKTAARFCLLQVVSLKCASVLSVNGSRGRERGM